jgi:Uma2 family endonuclease
MAINQNAKKATNNARSSAALQPAFIAGLPPLENGDYLSRPEFERRYEAMPWLKKAELIEGVAYMGAPVRFETHAQPHSLLIAWAVVYSASTPNVLVGDNATVRLDIDNEPQPDILLRLDPDKGGTSRIGADGYVEGPPELVIEIAASSASYDLRDKLRVYRRNGVSEYIVWQIYDQRLDWWQLNAGEYIPLKPDDSGVVRSNILPGLDLNVPALLENNMAQVLASLQQGLVSQEHAAFVAKLATTDPSAGSSR